MKVKMNQLSLTPTIRLSPELGIEQLIANIREVGQVTPLQVKIVPWDCWCEEEIVFHHHADGKCPKCGTVQNVEFFVIDGWRRVKAMQFLDIEEVEVSI